MMVIINAYFRELLYCEPATVKHLCGEIKEPKKSAKAIVHQHHYYELDTVRFHYKAILQCPVIPLKSKQTNNSGHIKTNV